MISKAREEDESTFERIDKNADRYIEIEEFTVLMLEMDDRCPATTLRSCFDAIDSDGDGRVTLAEFRAWLSHKTDIR